MKTLIQDTIQWISDVILPILAAPAKSLIDSTQSTLVAATIMGSAIIGGAMIFQSVTKSKFDTMIFESGSEAQAFRTRDAELRALRTELQLMKDFPDAELPVFYSPLYSSSN